MPALADHNPTRLPVHPPLAPAWVAAAVPQCLLLWSVASCPLSDEHCASQWVSAEQAQALFPAGHWLRVLIARAEVVRGLMSHALRQFYRHEGFEL
jgi:hypothetical protein